MKPHPRAVEPLLAEIARQSLTRLRRTVEEACELEGAEVAVDGRRLINFCGNDYLGLSRHPELIAALCQAAARYGVGSGASHLVTGHGREHELLEEELARFVGRERALLFSTGYMANLAAITALAGRGDLLLLDRLSHASLIDAALLSRARLRRYPHADAAALAHMLAEVRCTPAADRVTLIATDGLFSMDGDVAPVAELARSAARHRAWLLVDDAHGLGVLGASGRGTLEHLSLDPTSVPVLMGTLGKALGTFGAFLAGDRDVIELILQRARSYIYTTAAPQPLAAATRAALRILQREPWRRERVLELTRRFRAAALEHDVPLAASSTPIQPIVLGDAEATLTASRRLAESGFWVAAIRPPTVPRNTARLRVTLSAAHTDAQVDALVAALARCLAAPRRA
ncbi:MAG TPA: 8-amino-7-oxononanoate synthase [Steroidobacteraceae bacterium]|nr:8-amino-7-oxononanoate synthase [Steroidobacteraceae bacterium]